MDLWQAPHRPLEPFRPARPAAEIRCVGVADDLVVGRGEGGQDRKPPVTPPSARGVVSEAAKLQGKHARD